MSNAPQLSAGAGPVREVMDTQIRLQIDRRELFADGVSFGSVGSYERLSGRVAFAVDPGASVNSQIVDLGNAPRSKSGLVEFSTDLYILKPIDVSRGNRRLLYDVNNRGYKRILQFFNDAVHSNEPRTAEHAGNGFLMRQGYSVVWSGWQGDILPVEDRMTMDLPVAKDNGDEITGVVRSEFIADSPGTHYFPLSGNDYTASYESASLETGSATFTCREYERDRRIPIAADEWKFAAPEGLGNPGPSRGHCYLPEGFRPGWIYELVYTARNPPVLGLGFIGLRDLLPFLMHAKLDDDGNDNPLYQDGAGLAKVYGWGRSQSGRFLREFVHRGFNRDHSGRRVFDAIFPHVSGAGRVWLNHRFAQPGRYPRQHGDHLYPSDQFPFSYAITTDALTGKTDGILKRPKTDPLVVHTQTSSEYWERRGSLVHTDSSGGDLGEQKGARVYLFSSSQHHADPRSGSQIEPYRHPSNPLNTTPLLRALLVALDSWATDGTPPPDSRVPMWADESAVPGDVVKSRFPSISGVSCPVEPSQLYMQDHGPEFERGLASREPPEEDLSGEYTTLVPQIDRDGNEVPGIRTPQVEVPLATFTGWNFRPAGSAQKALAGVVGSYLPFARTEREREANEDSRPSLEKRYRSGGHYVRAIALAAQKLVHQRLLLEEDADRYVENAMSEPVVD